MTAWFRGLGEIHRSRPVRLKERQRKHRVDTGASHASSLKDESEITYFDDPIAGFSTRPAAVGNHSQVDPVPEVNRRDDEAHRRNRARQELQTQLTARPCLATVLQ